MSEIDFSKYTTIEQIVQDIKEIKIQGATNVALATFEGMKLFLQQYNGNDSYEVFINEVERIGYSLANARPNEPLAQNGLKFITNMVKINHHTVKEIPLIKAKINALVEEYLQFVKNSKVRIVENSIEVMTPDHKGVLTHCHSSTAEKVIINHVHRQPETKVVCTETRPLFQGRLTAKALVEAGVDTTLVADSAAESFIIDRGTFDVDIVFLGCDQITMQGDVINKIGSWGVAHAAYYASKPLYVVGSILKTDVSTAYKPVEIEMREAHELWPEAPEGLKMVNPAFEIVSGRMITGFITEVGILKPEEISKAIQREYQWLF